MPIQIHDFSAPELDVYARMSEAQLLNREHPEEGLFIAESPLVIGRALDAGFVPISALMEEKEDPAAQEIVARLGTLPIYTAPFEVLTQLTGFALTRGMLCVMRRKPLPAVEELCKNARRIAVLEDVMNPTNVGAIIRSAAALGIDAVLLTENSSNPLYRRAIRVSMGCVFQIPWTFCKTDWHNELKRLGFTTVAMALCEDTLEISDPKLRSAEKLAVVLGTEGEGLSERTITACDHTVKIPMAHGVDSLNVAAASAVAFWELTKQ